MTFQYQLWDLFGPISWPLWGGLAALICQWRQRVKWAHVWLWASALWLATMTISPLGRLLMIPLEESALTPTQRPAPTALILLTGSESLGLSAARGQIQVTAAGDRILHTAGLARAYPSLPLLIVGGLTGPDGRRDVDLAAGLLIEAGVDPARVRLLGNAPDTCANLARVAQSHVRGPTPWLVTSAFHMPRTMVCAEAAAVRIVAFPVDFRTTGSLRGWHQDSMLGRLILVDFALHEWAGLLAYRLTGRTVTLWPRCPTGLINCSN
jgi:uncharacterized SAM-binding protein YcdF (DUF218 family)